MRLLLLIVCMLSFNSFAEEMKALPYGDEYRQGIAQTLRQQEMMGNAQFNIRRIEAGNDMVYFCGLMKDAGDNFLTTSDDKYHIYDRVLIESGPAEWINAIRFDRDVDSLDDVHCHYGKEVSLDSSMLRDLVDSQGRENICQPVSQQDPLRGEILAGLRTRYVGDSNQQTLNEHKPLVKFKVKGMCATDKLALFCGSALGEAKSSYEYEDSILQVVLRKRSDGQWVPVPEGDVLTQQTAVSRCNAMDYAISSARLAEMAAKAEGQCLTEGDTRQIVGTLQEVGTGNNSWWAIQPDNPLQCVRDDDMSTSRDDKTLQLILANDERQRLKALVGKKVTASGDIFLSLSSDHHTYVVLDNIFELREVN